MTSKKRISLNKFGSDQMLYSYDGFKEFFLYHAFDYSLKTKLIIDVFKNEIKSKCINHI